ncbi:MAG: PqqD family protein [Prevotella sp.]|nr:PqqD family protein [Prevotella sp.]
MKIKNDFVLREVCGENVIFCEGIKSINFGKVITLNESAVWLWNEAKAQGDFTVESLTARLCEEYDVMADEARSSVTELIEKLEKEGVILNQPEK